MLVDIGRMTSAIINTKGASGILTHIIIFNFLLFARPLSFMYVFFACIYDIESELRITINFYLWVFKLRTEIIAYENGHSEITEIKTISCIL